RDRVLMHDEKLGVRTAADDAEDAIAFLPSRRAVAVRFDLARELEARNLRHDTGRRRISPLSLQKVGSIESGGANTHENLVRRWFGLGDLSNLEYFRTAERGDDRSSH